MLLKNIQPCELLSWCLDSGGDEYLESDFCWKFPYHIQLLCPRGQGGGGLKIIENVRASSMDDPYAKQNILYNYSQFFHWWDCWYNYYSEDWLIFRKCNLLLGGIRSTRLLKRNRYSSKNASFIRKRDFTVLLPRESYAITYPLFILFFLC